MSSFKPLFKAFAQPTWGTFSVAASYRSQFHLETIVVAGALLQCILSLVLPTRYAVVPAACIALVKVVDVYAIKYGLKHNPQLDNAIFNKFSAQLPDRQGNYGDQPAKKGLCVFLIGSRNNSPMGMLDSHNKKLNQFFGKMLMELKSDPDAHGYLGGSSWQGTERSANSASMLVMYFRSAADVHKYAHGPQHRAAWSWWYANQKDLKGISIFHELYDVPSGNYESVYDNMPPMLLGATMHKTVEKTEQGEQVGWRNPVVDARTGQLKSSRGRMARADGNDNVKYGYEASHGQDVASEKA